MKVVNIARALTLGIQDGWAQPVELSTSTNVEHLMVNGSDEDDVLTWQDRGINLGQMARAGRRSQAWREHYWPRRPRREV